MKRTIAFALSLPALALADEKSLSFGAYLDTYYAYDSNRPRNNERMFTTQPQRHDEPNLNLGYVDATLTTSAIRGRLAFQTGNSVEKNTVNYVDEKNWAKYIQESYVGVRLDEKTWIDGGIFLGNIGAESWISKDNWTYTRSMNLDYVPYYSAGLRLERKINDTDSFQFQVLNGWQNMNETNDSKAIGMQYRRLLTSKALLTYNNFFGDERVVAPRDRFRGYHNFILRYDLSDQWQTVSALDVGHQSQQKNNGVDLWYAATFTARRVLSPEKAIALRGEYYSDAHQSNVVTGTKNGFRVMSSSLTYDQGLSKNIIWRSEVRGFYSQDKIYPRNSQEKNRWDGLFVTSLTCWI